MNHSSPDPDRSVPASAPRTKAADEPRAEGRRSFLMFMAFFSLLFAGVMIWQGYRLLNAHEDTVGDGRTVPSYGYDLSNLTVDRTVLSPSGLPKNGQAALKNPTVIAAAEIADKARGWSRVVVSDDIVVGVTIGSEARAYPMRYLQWHEVVNDEVAGVPIAVTYNKLSDSVVVFDRRVDGATLTFGYSGLLLNSNLVMYDDQPGARSDGESLWSQLKFEAISGPKAGTKLAVIPMFYGKWSQWIESHPQTMVWAGEKAFKDRYNKRKILPGYYQKGELLFPVKPLPPEGATRKLMDEVTIPAADAPQSTPLKARARYFAWYAFHGDTGLE